MAVNQPGKPDKGAIEETRHRNLYRLLKPESIAVVGASDDRTKAGSRLLRSLSGFAGHLVAVHPQQKKVQGFSCFPSLLTLPEAVDLAILAIPAEHCIKVAEDAAMRGVGGILTVAGGFAEAGANGANLQLRLAAVCRDSGLRLLGPNTSGFLDPHRGCLATFAPGVQRVRKGRIGVIAQSGGINISLSLLIGRLGEGISLAVGLGNAVDVWFDDVLAAMADDSNTAVIVVGLEGIPQGRKLFDAVRAATTRKPVVALVAGRADIQEFAMSHTGNLMGSYQRTVAALTQAGAVIVDSSEAAAQAACVLANGRLSPRERPRIALVTGQAGPGLLIMDGLKSAGIEMPVLNVETIRRVQSYLPQLTFVKNPVDTGLPLPCFPEIVDAVAADSQIDVVLAFSLAETVVVDSAPALAAVKKKAGKPFVFGTLGESDDLHEMIETLHKEAIPVVQSPERLALAGVVLAADARACWRLSHTDVVDELLPQPRLEGEFDEHRAKTILEHYGICTPKRVLCQSLEDAVAAFRTLQKPVVVKIAAADITHKTEAGGVHLNIINEHQLSKAVYALGRIPTRYPGRFLVEELAPSGVELIVGGLRDESWGPIVMLGLGGILAEALEDTAIRLAPVSKLDVDEMLDSLRGRKLFDGFRNLPVCDRAAIHQAVLAISQLLTEHPEVREVEINPLLVYASGAVALDAILGLRDGSGDKDRQESTRCRE